MAYHVLIISLIKIVYKSYILVLLLCKYFSGKLVWEDIHNLPSHVGLILHHTLDHPNCNCHELYTLLQNNREIWINCLELHLCEVKRSHIGILMFLLAEEHCLVNINCFTIHACNTNSCPRCWCVMNIKLVEVQIIKPDRKKKFVQLNPVWEVV